MKYKNNIKMKDANINILNKKTINSNNADNYLTA